MSFVADAALVAETNAALSTWKQGDIVGLGAAMWLGSSYAPLTEHAAQAASSDESNLAALLADAEALVVVSQTCDIVRDCSTRPHVQLARLVRLAEPVATEAARGHRPRFAPVPALGSDAFVDLDLMMTIEKSVLVRLDRTQGLSTDEQERRFALGVGRAYSRFAFPDDLAESLRGLVARIRGKHDKNSPEGRALAALEEVRVTGVPSWSADHIDVFLTFAPPTRGDADAVCTAAEWDALVDSWTVRADTLGVINAIDGAMIPLDELTAREYIDSDPLDLDHLSWVTASPAD